MANKSGSPTPQPKIDVRQQNALARGLVLQNSVNCWLPIFTQTITTGVGTVVNVPVRNVGLIKRFIIEMSFTYTNGAGGTITLSRMGAANALSNVLFTDLSNQTRINTAGWHLFAVSSAKSQKPFGSAATVDNPCGYGSNFTTTWQAPATINASTAGTVNCMYEVPVAYHDADLRGAIYANVVNATMNLQFTVNPSFVVATGADATLAVYQSAGASGLGTLTSFTVTVYQNYLDQLPMTNQGPVLPMLDIATAYLLNNSAVSGLVTSQDNNIPYANFRDFLSTCAIYNNAGTLNLGTDINYWAIQSANFSNIIKADPSLVALWARVRNQDDFPRGFYYFDHREKPINTVQFGNMGLIANLSSVTAGASILLGYESLALINQVIQAGSLAST